MRAVLHSVGMAIATQYHYAITCHFFKLHQRHGCNGLGSANHALMFGVVWV